MNDINTELTRIEGAKADIKTAIEAKGVTVGDGTIDTYAAKVAQISTGDSHNAFKVASIQERDALEDVEEGDVCVVQSGGIGPMTESIAVNGFSSIIIPENVTLPSQISDSYNANFRGSQADIEVMIQPGLVYIQVMAPGNYFNFEYQTQDNIHFTISDSTSDPAGTYDLGDIVTLRRQEDWNDIIGYFLLQNTVEFSGVYKATVASDTVTWDYLDVGIYSSNEDILLGKKAYTNDGTVTGTLGTTTALTLDDNAAAIYEKAQKTYDNMQSIVIPANILPDGYFYNHLDMGNMVVLPNRSNGDSILDTTAATTFVALFASCKKLVSVGKINVPQNITSAESMFIYCSKLKNIQLFDTSNITNMVNMFARCTDLETIPLFNTGNVTTMAYMFDSCSSLTTMPLLDTSSVTTMLSMFSDCRSLTSIPLLDTSSVTTMQNMFGNCHSLLSIPLLDTSNVTNMAGMFAGCGSLTTVPLLDTSNVTDMTSMFTNCYSLTDSTLDNILIICMRAVNISSSNKKLTYIGFGYMTTIYPASRIQALPHYQDFVNAGWSIGY